jgi:hypothetical protein
MNPSNMNLDMNTLYQVNKIIDMQRYNGRVNLFDQPNPDAQFKMQERLAIKNKTTEYRESLDGVWETNVLSQVYFSADNIQILQNGLRAGVYKKSDNRFIIAPQNIDILKIIMRSIYLQYAEHRMEDITGQVQRLNQLVLDYAIPTVYNEAVGYVRYCQDQSSLVVPLEVPRHHDRNYKQLELKPFF